MNEWEWQLLEDKTQADTVSVPGGEIKKGDLVRLRPKKGGDIFDLALAGKTAIVESIEQDYEGRFHLAVILEDDPGKDMGALRQPGHRFFFTPEEVEPAAKNRKILVAGVGNIFLGDDGFGVEVVRRLSSQNFPESVRVADFGIRSYDLAYALLDGYDVSILVDASSRGDAPGTLYVIEPDVNGTPEAAPDAHSMTPAGVLRLAKGMGTVSGRILLVACEPATLGGEEGHMGLSEPVSAAVDGAVELIEKLVDKILKGEEETNGSDAQRERTS